MDLIRALDFVPLAVNQAAAYINRRAPRVSVHSYLQNFLDSERRKSSLLGSDFGDLRRREDVSNSVVVTWQITFEQIRQERPSASQLLSLMSLFQSQNIPEFMLNDYTEEAVDKEDGEAKVEGFEDDLDVLRGYSLVNIAT